MILVWNYSKEATSVKQKNSFPNTDPFENMYVDISVTFQYFQFFWGGRGGRNVLPRPISRKEVFIFFQF